VTDVLEREASSLVRLGPAVGPDRDHGRTGHGNAALVHHDTRDGPGGRRHGQVQVSAGERPPGQIDEDHAGRPVARLALQQQPDVGRKVAEQNATRRI